MIVSSFWDVWLLLSQDNGSQGIIYYYRVLTKTSLLTNTENIFLTFLYLNLLPYKRRESSLFTALTTRPNPYFLIHGTSVQVAPVCLKEYTVIFYIENQVISKNFQAFYTSYKLIYSQIVCYVNFIWHLRVNFAISTAI